MEKKLILQMTADIVASHASMNELTQEELLLEIEKVYNKLACLSECCEMVEETPASSEAAAPVAKVPLEAAFGADKIFCMICGKGMKTLKRHISVAHGLKPGQYRKQFGIPTGTALVAKNYSDARKKLAKNADLADRLVKARAARGKKKAK